MENKVDIPAVEVGVLVQHLDPEKTYVFEQVSPVFGMIEEARAALAVSKKGPQETAPTPIAQYVEGVGWVGKVLLTSKEFTASISDAFKDVEATKNPDLNKDTKDACILWFLAGTDTQTYGTFKEYGAEKPMFKITVDASGLLIDESKEE